mgnify:CR=1 FL=1
MEEITPNDQDQIDDILYFEKKLLIAFSEKNWDNVIIAAKRLKQMDECLIVYRLNRSSERNVVTVDVGNLSSEEAESKIKEIMKKFKGKTDE